MGEEFETVHILKRLQNVFVDLFHGKTTKLVNLGSMEYVYTFAYVNSKIMMRTYKYVCVENNFDARFKSRCWYSFLFFIFAFLFFIE